MFRIFGWSIMQTGFIKLAKQKLKANPYASHILRSSRLALSDLMRRDTYIKDVKDILKDIDFRRHFKKIEMPQITTVGITNICNLNCLMCQTNVSERPKGFMSLETFEILLKQLKKIKIDLLGIAIQGEPFLHKKIIELLSIAKRYGFSVWINTNGQFPEEIESIYRNFPNLIRYYRISIDGATKETYEHIRKGAFFETLLKSLETVHKINKNKRNSRIKLYINVVLSTANLFELNQFFEKFRKYCNTENITFSIIDSVAPDTAYFWSVFPFKNLIKRGIPCHRPFETMNFTFSGALTLCCEDFNDELTVGDIHKDSIADIWNGRDAKLIRNKHLNKQKMDIAICQKCFRPYRFVLEITNKYIHFLYDYQPGLDSTEFGNKVLIFLKNMDEIMQSKDIETCKQFILKEFCY